MVIVIAAWTKTTLFQTFGINQVTTPAKISALVGIIFCRDRQQLLNLIKWVNSCICEKIGGCYGENKGKT